MSIAGANVHSFTVADDPFRLLWRAANKAKTLWLKHTYPFAEFGRGVSVHYSCSVRRPGSMDMSLGDNVQLAEGAWLMVIPGGDEKIHPKLVLGPGCNIGKRAHISSHNQIVLEADVLLAPSVLIMDHNHEFSDPERPIIQQGVTSGGKIFIGKNCWIGQGAAIVCGHGELVIGRNSVVGANAVVTRSFPPFSVIAGAPARLIRRFEPTSGAWIRVSGDSGGDGAGS